MKMTTKIAGLLLLLLCGLAQAEWIVYGVTKDAKVYSYDPARVVPLSDGKVKVWYKEEWNAQSKITEIESLARQSEGLGAGGRESAMLFREKIPRYKNYSHTLHREIFDCRHQTYKFEESIDYSDDGAVLDKINMDSIIQEGIAKGLFTGNEKRFSEIFPGSIMELLMNKVCQ